MKPFADSCEQNKQSILAVLKNEFADASRVLEIGSGTGQHAVYFGKELPHLSWQTSDVQEHHAGIHAWLSDAQLDNVLPPLELDVTTSPWPNLNFDAVFSANTAHIMAWSEVEKMFACIGNVLLAGGSFCLYGPFNIEGRYSAQSNARFDQWLKQRDPQSGIRDMADLDRLGAAVGLIRVGQHEMPADNFTLVWQAVNSSGS